jgi:hypothetical protein
MLRRQTPCNPYAAIGVLQQLGRPRCDAALRSPAAKIPRNDEPLLVFLRQQGFIVVWR